MGSKYACKYYVTHLFYHTVALTICHTTKFKFFQYILGSDLSNDIYIYSEKRHAIWLIIIIIILYYVVTLEDGMTMVHVIVYKIKYLKLQDSMVCTKCD